MELNRKLDNYIGCPLTLFIFSLFFWKKLFKRILCRTKIKSILIIKLSGLGDYALLIPTLIDLKKELSPNKFFLLTFADSNFEFVNTDIFSGVIRLSKNKILTEFWNVLLRIRKGDFDLIIDFTFSPYTTGILTFFSNTRFSLSYKTMGFRKILYDNTLPFLPYRHISETYYDAVRFLLNERNRKMPSPLLKLPKDERFIDNFFKMHSISNKDLLIGIHPCSMMSNTNKRHWVLGRYIALANRLIYEFKAKVIFSGTEREGAYLKTILKDMNSEAIISCFNLTLPEFFSVMTHFKLFIAIDSGPMHIASLMGIPTIGLFGPDSPLRFAPIGPQRRFVYCQTKCSPCVTSYKGIWKRCTDMRCMESISVDDVFKNAATLLKMS